MVGEKIRAPIDFFRRMGQVSYASAALWSPLGATIVWGDRTGKIPSISLAADDAVGRCHQELQPTNSDR